MDNKIFNVNGSGKERLAAVLALAMHNGHSAQDAKGWRVSKKHGLILLSSTRHEDGKFLIPISAEEITPMVMSWLNSKEAKEIELDGWDENCDHDGHNTLGWRVYCEDWGHVDNDWSAICAIKPAYMWQGK